MRSRRLVTIGALAAALAACGPTPPQAPLPEAKKLDEATGGISTACGEAYQVTAFPGPRQPFMTVLEATAISDAIKLGRVLQHNPNWIYQGDTITELVHDSLVMLRACGLNDAARVLSRVSSTGRSG